MSATAAIRALRDAASQTNRCRRRGEIVDYFCQNVAKNEKNVYLCKCSVALARCETLRCQKPRGGILGKGVYLTLVLADWKSRKFLSPSRMRQQVDVLGMCIMRIPFRCMSLLRYTYPLYDYKNPSVLKKCLQNCSSSTYRYCNTVLRC